MTTRTSFRSTLVEELEAENARLRRTAAELTVYLLTLQAALGNRAAPPRRLGELSGETGAA